MHLDEIRIKKNNKKILCQNSITFPILYISSKNHMGRLHNGVGHSIIKFDMIVDIWTVL